MSAAQQLLYGEKYRLCGFVTLRELRELFRFAGICGLAVLSLLLTLSRENQQGLFADLEYPRSKQPKPLARTPARWEVFCGWPPIQIHIAAKAQVLKRVHIIGRKNSGKTTLIVDLVRHLSSMGHRVATIKHTHHRHELDTPGKDSHSHRQAGAAAVGILSPGLSAVFVPIDPDQSTADRYEHLYRMFPDCDLVLVEGHATASGTKVEVWRKEITDSPLAVNDRSIVGLVTDDPVDVSVPVWSRTDIRSLADKVLQIVAE